MDAHAGQGPLLESAYKSYAPRISYPPYSELSGIEVVVDDLGNSRADARRSKAQEFINEEILHELDNQGFFKSVQKQILKATKDD